MYRLLIVLFAFCLFGFINFCTLSIFDNIFSSVITILHIYYARFRHCKFLLFIILRIIYIIHFLLYSNFPKNYKHFLCQTFCITFLLQNCYKKVFLNREIPFALIFFSFLLALLIFKVVVFINSLSVNIISLI